jgi:hypothetical protein
MVPLFKIDTNFPFLHFNEPVDQAVRATDSNASQRVTLSLAEGTPSWATLVGAIVGNPATATLRLAPGVFDYLFAVAGVGSEIGVIAMDNGAPPLQSRCNVQVRMMLF